MFTNPGLARTFSEKNRITESIVLSVYKQKKNRKEKKNKKTGLQKELC